MGLNLSTMFVSIRGDNTRLRASLKKSEMLVQKSMSRMRASVGQMFSQAGIVGFGYAMFQGAKAAATFEDSMVQVRINANLLGKEGAASFKKLEAEAKKLGATTRFTAGEAAAAMNQLALAGLDVNEVLGATGPVLNLATAAGIELAESSKIATTQMKIWQMSAKDIPRISDTLVAAQSNMRTTVKDLNEGMAIAGSIAKKVGMSFEEVAAAIGILQERSGSASLAGTALSIAIQRMSAPSKDAQEELKKMNINLDDFRRKSGELDILRVMDQMTEMGITVKAATKLFGARGKEIIKVFDAVGKSGEKGSHAIRAMAKTLEKSTGFAAKAAAARMETFIGKLLELKSALEDVAITLIGPLLDGLLAVMKPMTQMFRGITPLNDALRGLGSNTLKVTLALAGLAYILPRIGKAVRALGAVIRYQMLSTGWGAVFVVVGLVAVSLLQLYDYMKANPDVKWVQDLKEIWNNLVEIWKTAIDILGELIGIGPGFYENFIEEIKHLSEETSKWFNDQATYWSDFGLQSTKVLKTLVTNWELATKAAQDYVSAAATLYVDRVARDTSDVVQGLWQQYSGSTMDRWVSQNWLLGGLGSQSIGKGSPEDITLAEKLKNVFGDVTDFTKETKHIMMWEQKRSSDELMKVIREGNINKKGRGGAGALGGALGGVLGGKISKTFTDLQSFANMQMKFASKSNARVGDQFHLGWENTDVRESSAKRVFATMFKKTASSPDGGATKFRKELSESSIRLLHDYKSFMGRLLDFTVPGNYAPDLLKEKTAIQQEESLLGRGSTGFGGMGRSIQDAILQKENTTDEKRNKLLEEGNGMSLEMVQHAERMERAMEALPTRITPAGVLGE